jgi:hypothetical protein
VFCWDFLHASVCAWRHSLLRHCILFSELYVLVFWCRSSRHPARSWRTNSALVWRTR